MQDQKAWEWLNGNQLAYDIWEKKYRYNNESFDEWLYRVSGGNIDALTLIATKKFLPAGRILSNRGLYKDGVKVTYSNCYVQEPPKDNIESIFDCAKEIARTFSYGGGVGVDISNLAPRGAKVNNTARETSGAVSFMDLYSMVTGLIGQHGRRGALMISIDCTHPDLEEFIDIKTDLNKVTKANISVKITDEFMEAVEWDAPFELEFVREETGEVITKTVQAKEIFHKLCKNNWNYAEPGMLFWDTISKYNLLQYNDEFSYAGVNPCAEEPLPSGGSCLLSSINLAEFVKNPFTPEAEFDWNGLCTTVDIAVSYLNNILDEGLPLHPLAKQQETVRDWRQIGLGVMGVADALIKLGIRYGSKDAIDLCDMIGFTIANQAIEASSFLAELDGVYPKYDISVLQSDFFINNTSAYTHNKVVQHGLRNSQLLTIAPTGTLSTMLGVSGGIEPIFANSYTRKTESLHGKDTYYKVYTPIVEEYMKATGITDEEDLPEYFVTSAELDPIERIKMQAIFQKHIDASISSTINLPQSTTVEDVEEIYLEAWKHGLKGITIYRAGCAREGILVEDKPAVKEEVKEEKTPIKKDELPRGFTIDVNDDAIGKKRKLTTGCGSLHCSAFFDPITGELLETYLSKGSTGGCNNFMIGLSRMISLSARAGVPIESIIDQLNSCGSCPSYAVRKATKKDTSKGSCCPIAIGYALKDMYDEMHNDLFGDIEDEVEEESAEYRDTAKITDIPKKKNTPKCPECDEPITFEGGCNICKACGWSKCD